MHFLSPDSLAELLRTYGYLAVFAVIALESAGVPLPGEATLVAASILAATTHALSLPIVIATASAAAIVGDNLGFWAGRRFGVTLLLRYGGRVGLDQSRLKLAQYLFMRFGGRIVFFGRFVAVLRALAAVLAGANRYPWRKFVVLNAAGGTTWAASYASAAYALGSSTGELLGRVGLILTVVVAAILILTWRFLERHRRQFQAEAEKALPGPLPSIGN